MKNFLFISMLFFCTNALIAQTNTRTIGNYSALKVSGGITVELVKQSSPTAAITMVKGEEGNLITSVEGGELNIYFKKAAKNNWASGEQATIKLGFNELNSIQASAGGFITGTEKIKTSKISIKSSSGSGVNVCVDSQNCYADASSGATLSVEGVSNNLKVSASSGAVVNANKLTAQSVDANASSGAAVKVHARESITANASSGGAIKYVGEPAQTNIDAGKWSGGSISKM